MLFHFTSLAVLFNQTLSQLLWEASSHKLRLIHCSYTYPLLFIASYSCIQLSELEKCRVKKLAMVLSVKNPKLYPSATVVYTVNKTQQLKRVCFSGAKRNMQSWRTQRQTRTRTTRQRTRRKKTRRWLKRTQTPTITVLPKCWEHRRRRCFRVDAVHRTRR